MTDRCDECGYDYGSVPAIAVAAAVRSDAAQLASLLGPGAADRRVSGVWSVLEYACHVRDVLLVQRERVILARWTETPELAPMARDLRAEYDGYAEQEPAAVARQLSDAALLFANVLDRLDEPAWDRTLIYNFPEPRERSLRWVAAHTLHELRHHLIDARGLV